mmetsp:Transcript_15327/g.14906  ORF Transcript_15327/g.14906 Transcript_15327/m.14906 type:complete len:100 (+) Transcript_15327:92-391(+)
MRGMIILRKSNVRTFFILDTEVGVMHLFKNVNQPKPSRSLGLSGGSFPEDSKRLISDPTSGQIIPSFEFLIKKRKGLPRQQFTIIPENPENYANLKEAF